MNVPIIVPIKEVFFGAKLRKPTVPKNVPTMIIRNLEK